MPAKRVVKIGFIGLAACVVVGGAVLGGILWRIHEAVGACCHLAQQSHPHPGDDVAALVAFMESGTHPLRERNRAVWTLGRLRAAQALPALESVYTGERCQHDRSLCQYELAKAITRCGGSPEPARETGH